MGIRVDIHGPDGKLGELKQGEHGRTPSATLRAFGATGQVHEITNIVSDAAEQNGGREPLAMRSKTVQVGKVDDGSKDPGDKGGVGL